MFGQGSRASVAVTILVRNPAARHEGCRILYRDVGDYLKREEKLAILSEAGSIAGIDEWREIAPDRHNDWIDQRSDEFQELYPMGSKATKAGRMDEAIFKLYSNGYKTRRDAYVYNFSRDSCAYNARKMVQDYLGALHVFRQSGSGNRVDEATRNHSSNVRWDETLKSKMIRGKETAFDDTFIRCAAYRPFVNQFLFADELFAQRPAQTSLIFPDAGENVAIYVPGVGSTKPFSALVVDKIPDLHHVSFGQCFPRYRYEQPKHGQPELPGIQARLERVDNIPDTALRAFRVQYSDSTITKDGIFDYVYGILHASGYRERFANDLSKELPRIPMAPDFRAFANAGRVLAELHLGYEECEEYPLEIVFPQLGSPRPEHYRIDRQAMRFADGDRSVLIVNEHIRLAGIPAEAHEYHVNGRTPLEWFIDRYRVTQDRESGIVNDPNEWFDDPEDLIAAIRRIVYVSLETVCIVKSLPDPFPIEEG